MHTAKSEFYTIYDLVEMCLGEIDNEFENTLACLSGWLKIS